MKVPSATGGFMVVRYLKSVHKAKETQKAEGMFLV